MGIRMWIRIHVCGYMYLKTHSCVCVYVCGCIPYVGSGMCVCMCIWVYTDKGSELEAGTTSYWPVNMHNVYIYIYMMFMCVCVCVNIYMCI